MGSISDWPSMKLTCQLLADFGIPYEKHILSAHRMPEELQAYGKKAQQSGLKVLIAGAGGAAHLPGMLAANTLLPVIGVPMQTHALSGVDSVLSILQMPYGTPVATVSIGAAGARNAALLAAQILALTDANLRAKLVAFKAQQKQEAQNSESRFD